MKPSKSLQRARRRAAGLALQASKQAEARYVRDVRGILRGVHAAFMAYMLPKLPQVATRVDGGTRHTRYGMDLDGLEIHILAQVPGKVATAFDRMAKKVASVHGKAHERLLGIKATDMRIPVQIAEARRNNVALVVNAGRVYSQQVKDIFDDPQNFGRSVAELKDMLLDRGSVSDSRADLIARDQTLKLNGAINQARQENAGVSQYTWSTSHDERVRPEHAELDGQMFDWSSPPEPGHPGEDFQCRCVGLPVIAELEGI